MVSLLLVFTLKLDSCVVAFIHFPFFLERSSVRITRGLVGGGEVVAQEFFVMEVSKMCDWVSY